MRVYNEEETFKFIQAYNGYVNECTEKGIRVLFTFPEYKRICKTVKELYN